MVSTSHLARALALCAAFGLLLPGHSRPADAAIASRSLRPHLTVDGVPPPDPALIRRLQLYQRSRQATFLDWLPGGGMLVATRFGAAQQVHRVTSPLGEREQLTFQPDPVLAARARPGGGGFVFLEGQGDGQPSQLYYYTGSGRVRQLTHGWFTHGSLTWAHDGKRVAFYGNERDGVDEDIYVVDVTQASPTPQLVVTGQGGTWLPLGWSADDRQLLVLKTVSLEEGDLYLADVATGALTPLLPADPGSNHTIGIRSARFAPDGHGIYLISDEGGEFTQLRYLDPATHQERVVTPQISWDVEDFDVSSDGRYIAYTVNDDGRSELTVQDTVGKVEITPPGVPTGHILNLRFDREHRLAFSVETGQSPRDVYVYDLDHPVLQRWTRSETGPLDPASFAPAELVHYPTWDRVDGHRRMLSAYVYRPRGTTPCPVVISFHGGPDEQYRPGWEPFFQFLVNELGYAVIAPNLRGSSGYGKSFMALDNGTLRQDAVRDVGSLLVWIGLQPAFDGRHVAVMGSGYGGYMAFASLATYGDRLNGAIDVLGINNFVSYLNGIAEQRRGPLRLEYGDERESRMRDFLERISPVSNVGLISQPMLLIQGPSSPDAPQSDTQDLLWRLRSHGDEVWYVEGQQGVAETVPTTFTRQPYLETVALFLRKLAAGNLTATARP